MIDRHKFPDHILEPTALTGFPSYTGFRRDSTVISDNLSYVQLE
jgi:hypothetical protein